ncbi:hypothetical protein DFJ73DRAFT_427549 [Zopfochytrium polystomum]|nr:hypothetical protein DFJ73DRAFT_427549 [Zopfochytrium polystomum]
MMQTVTGNAGWLLIFWQPSAAPEVGAAPPLLWMQDVLGMPCVGGSTNLTVRGSKTRVTSFWECWRKVLSGYAQPKPLARGRWTRYVYISTFLRTNDKTFLQSLKLVARRRILRTPSPHFQSVL